MKRIFVFASLLLSSCTYPVQTKQQRAEELVEEYIHISNNPKAIKETKFTKVEISNSNSYVIGIIINKWDSHQRIFLRTEWFSINKNLTHIDFIYTN